MHVLITGPMPVIAKFARFSTHNSKVYQLINLCDQVLIIGKLIKCLQIHAFKKKL